MELDTFLHNSEPMDTASNTNTMQSTSTSGQNTLPSTTVNTTPHYTGNTLPNMVPQAIYNPYVQFTTLPTQGGHNPSSYYYVPPINAAFKNHRPTTYMPPPYSQVAYLPRQQVYPSTYMVPGQILPHQFSQQYRTPQQSLYVQQPQQMSLHFNGSTTTQDIDSPVSQEPVTIQDTPTQNPPSQTESSTSINGNSTMAISRENNTSIVDVSSTSNPTPQVPAIVAPPITTTANNSDIETHGADPSTEEIYEVVGGPVGNDNDLYESRGSPPSHSDLYNDTD